MRPFFWDRLIEFDRTVVRGQNGRPKLILALISYCSYWDMGGTIDAETRTWLLTQGVELTGQHISCIVFKVPLSGKRIIKILLQRGWAIKSQRGSHVKLVKDRLVTSIPTHGNHDLGIGLIRAIEKQTGEKLL